MKKLTYVEWKPFNTECMYEPSELNASTLRINGTENKQGFKQPQL